MVPRAWLIGTASGTSPAAGGAVLRRVAVALVQRRQHVQFALEGKDELLAQQLGGRW